MFMDEFHSWMIIRTWWMNFIHRWWNGWWWMHFDVIEQGPLASFQKKARSWALDCVTQNTCSRSDSCFKQVMSSRVVCSSTMPSSTVTIFVKENKESLRIFWFYSFFPKWNLQSKMNYSTPKCWTFHGTTVLWFMINSNKHILEISSKSIVQLAHFDLWSMVMNTSLIAMSGFK